MVQSQGVYIEDYLSLIRRNITPCAVFHFYPPNHKLHPTLATLMDYSYRRFFNEVRDLWGNVEVSMGWTEDMRQETARITNVTVERGMVPYANRVGSIVENELTGQIEMKERRVWGAKAVMEDLVRNNVVRPTMEVGEFLNIGVDDVAALAPRERWYFG